MRRTALIITSAAVVASLAGAGAAFAATQTPNAATSAIGTPTGTATQTAARTAPADAADLDAAIEAALAEVGPGTVIEADVDDDSNHAYEIDVRLDGGGEVEVKLDADLAIVSVRQESPDDDGDGDDASKDDASDDDASEAVTDASVRAKAEKAALAEVGSGTVVSVELSDDADHVYEVEIDLGNGRDADVELDADFRVVKVD
jgi:uncharacterized membrane protein YkoI